MPENKQKDTIHPRMGWGEARIIYHDYYKDIQALISLGWTLKKIHRILFEFDELLSYGQLLYYQNKATKAGQAQNQSEPESEKIPGDSSPKSELPRKRWKCGLRSLFLRPVMFAKHYWGSSGISVIRYVIFISR